MISNFNMKRSQRGFSLIEALVAFMLLSVGMLGVASLQSISLQSGQTAALRTVAVVKAGEILDRIRANPTQINGYAVSTAGSGTDNGCNSGTVCTAGELAADDIYNWKQSLKDALPNNVNTTASIVVTPPGLGGALTNVLVTVNWQERNLDSAGMSNQSYSIESSMCGALRC